MPRGHAGRRRRGRSTLGIIVALYLVLSTIVAQGTARFLHNRAGIPLLAGSVASPPPAPKYLVLFVLDGARPDYMDLASFPHLDALRASGTQFSNAISGILEAETPSGHATIATGSRPDRNGILGFDWANDNDRVSLFSPDQMGAMEADIQQTGVPTIAGLYKKRFPHATVVALSGHKYYAAAPLGGPDADAIMYYQGDEKGRYVPVAVPGHVPPSSLLNSPDLIDPNIHLADGQEDHLVTRLALATVKQMRPRLLLMNYPEFDWPLGHVYGGSLAADKAAALMRGFDEDLGRIEDAYRAAGILNQTLFVITADHGMMPITRFVPSSVINNAITQAGTTAPDIAGSSADYVWLADQSKAQAVAENILKAGDPGIQSAYYLSTAGTPHYVAAGSGTDDPATEAANQYLLQALMNGHQPSVVVFGNEGVTFSDPGTKWKADHGGPSWDSQHIPLIMAGPGIVPGKVDSSAVQLEDVAPTLLSDMGATPTGMSGHVLTDALVDSPQALQQARKDEIGWLDPVVQAITVMHEPPQPRA